MPVERLCCICTLELVERPRLDLGGNCTLQLAVRAERSLSPSTHQRFYQA